MFAQLFQRLAAARRRGAQTFRRRFLVATKPAAGAPLVGTLADPVRSKPELIAENAVLRQQLVILQRTVKRPRCTPTARSWCCWPAACTPGGTRCSLSNPIPCCGGIANSLLASGGGSPMLWPRHTALPSRPRQSCSSARWPPPTAPGAPSASAASCSSSTSVWPNQPSNATCGALAHHDDRDRRGSPSWPTTGRDIWAAAFLPVTDLLFRQVYTFFVIEIASRRVVHVGVTRRPTDARVAQQLREATPFGQHPKHLIVDNDSKYAGVFARVAQTTGTDIVRTAFRAPKENAICERFLGSVRRERLDHLLVLGETHLRRILREHATYFNRNRPHQGLGQRIPDPPEEDLHPLGSVQALPVLGRLHHTYRRAA